MSEENVSILAAKIRKLREIHARRIQGVTEVYELTRRVCERLNSVLGDDSALSVSSVDGAEWHIILDGETVAKCNVAMRDRVRPGWSVAKVEVPLNFEVTTLKGADSGSLLGGTVTETFEVSWFKIDDEMRWCRLDEARKDYVPVVLEWIEARLTDALIKHVDDIITERDLKAPIWK